MPMAMASISSWTLAAQKRWVLRTMVQGVRRDIGLGGVTLVSLAEARDKAATMRKCLTHNFSPFSNILRAVA